MKKTLLPRFKQGDTVTWASQAGGYRKIKTGVVAEVLAAGQMPCRERFASLYKSSGLGSIRPHESYVVAVGTRPYWPRVAALREVLLPERIVTADEYWASRPKGWHQVCLNVDGRGNIGIRTIKDAAPREAHRTMTDDEYRALAFKGWHEVWHQPAPLDTLVDLRYVAGVDEEDPS